MSKNKNIYPVTLTVEAKDVLPSEFKMAVRNMHQARRLSRSLIREWKKEAGFPSAVSFSFQRKLETI